MGFFDRVKKNGVYLLSLKWSFGVFGGDCKKNLELIWLRIQGYNTFFDGDFSMLFVQKITELIQFCKIAEYKIKGKSENFMTHSTSFKERNLAILTCVKVNYDENSGLDEEKLVNGGFDFDRSLSLGTKVRSISYD